MSPDTPTPPPTPSDPGAGSDPATGADAERLLEVGLSQAGGPTPPPEPEALAAQFPQFEILEVLGRGGMGIVYKARQRKLDRLVALKVLPRELGEDPAFTERFAREGRTLARLQHPHIVGVHDFGEADGQSYLVMEYVDGVNLRALMASGELTATEALAIVPQICAALQYAHDEGVVHRDIKPENVLLDRQGNVKVADFGLAKMAERAPGDFTLTGTDQVMGTLHYMAPEQYKTPQDVDHRADIFSLGVVFYEMLTGELPVGRFDEPSKTGDLDARIDEIVMRTLAREREQRFQQARDVSTAVGTYAEAASASSGVPAGMPAPDERPPRSHAVAEAPSPARRRWSRWTIATLILFLLTPAAGGIAYGLVNQFAPYPNRYVFDDVAGWIVTLVGFGLTGLFAIVAIAVTQALRAHVRGQWASVGLLVLSAAGLVAGFLMLGEEVPRANEQVREYRKQGYFGGDGPQPLPFGSRGEQPVGLTVDARHTATAAERQEVELGIRAALESFSGIVARDGARVEDLARRRLYDAEDLQALRALGGDDADERRAAGELGLGMLARSPVLAYWEFLHLEHIRFDGARARVTLVADPIGRSGTRMVDARPPLRQVTFRMKKAPHGWVFAIDPVEVH